MPTIKYKTANGYVSIPLNVVQNDVVQTTGQSTTAVMSQKAVTDALQSINFTGELIHYLTSVSGTAGTINTDCSQWIGSADGVTALYSGLMVSIKIPVVGVNVGITLNVNSLGAHPVLINADGLLTSHYPVGCIVVLTYDADATASVTIDSTATEITGCWKVSDYNTNTTYSAGTAALLTEGTNTSNRVWLAKILADYIAYPNVKYPVATQSKSGALSIDGSKPIHVVTATGNITSVALSTSPEDGHSTHVIIFATAARTVAVAHHATSRVCPGATSLSLSIPANGYVELDFLKVGTKTYVRGV